MEFRELSDEEWVFIESLLPPRTGGPRADDRTVNGVLYVLVAGCRWMDMSPKYGSYVTAWRRLKRWMELGYGGEYSKPWSRRATVWVGLAWMG